MTTLTATPTPEQTLTPPTTEIPLHEREFTHILLWMPNWIGDVILAIPTVQSLRVRYPNARITAVVQESAYEILSAHPAIDSVIKLAFTEEQGILGRLQFASDLKKYQFDLAVVFPNSFRSALMARLSDAKVRLGYDTEFRKFLLTNPTATTRISKKEYRVNYFFKILAPLGIHTLETKYQPFISRAAYDSAKVYLDNLGMHASDFLITIHPTTSKPERSWHAERYAMLCQRLIKEYPAKIILLGSENDVSLLEKIKGHNNGGRIISLPQLSLQETAVIIEKSSLFIGNDSGMMHLAAMVGTPLVGIFGPGSPATSGPFIDPQKKVTVSQNFPCSPCRQKFFKECKPSAHNKPNCLEDISVKELIEAVEKLIQKTGKKFRN